MINLVKINNDDKDIISRDKDLQSEIKSLKERHARGIILFHLLNRRERRHQNAHIGNCIDQLELKTKLSFPRLTTEQIDYLFKIAYSNAERYFNRYGQNSPYQKNGREKDATIFFQNELSELESFSITPAVGSKTRRLLEDIPLIGLFVPDLLLIGREWVKGMPIVCIEIDGKPHEILKAVKDGFMETELRKLGVLTVRVKADQVHLTRATDNHLDFDRNYMGTIADGLKKANICSEELLEQTTRRIMLYTISMWLDVDSIDRRILNEFGINPHLRDHLTLEHFKSYRPDWVRGAKKRHKIRNTLSNGLKAKAVLSEAINEEAS